MRRRRLSATLAALTLAAALGTTATAAAAPADAGTTAVPVCADGYVCVHHDGVITLVPEGADHTFDPAVRLVAAVNSTKTGYCLTGTFNRGLGAGETWEPASGYALSRLAPSGSGFCLTED